MGETWSIIYQGLSRTPPWYMYVHGVRSALQRPELLPLVAQGAQRVSKYTVQVIIHVHIACIKKE